MATIDKLFAEKVKGVDIPDYGQFHIRIVTGAERQHYINSVRKVDEASNEIDLYTSLLVSAIAEDDHGKRFFGQDEQDKVRDMPAPLIKALFDAAHDFNFPKPADIKKN